MEEKTVDDSRVDAVFSVLPEDTNIYGNLFGGKLVEWIDRTAAIVAVRHSRKNVVTANIDNLSFLEPIKLGDIVILKAWINYVGNTSMEVQVDVYNEKRSNGRLVLACRAFITYVAIDENGKPSPVPRLLIRNEEERNRYNQALERKEQRLRMKRQI
ncbi:MAG: acyl-CoA thioesterase [Thermoplasmata archaeon]|jgi:acyl-CoA hydrolase|nr:acyl-CoA thioesterase [Thermoplasmatales archaeon]PMP75577.1 MAG: acyl-CoA thioesterase [Aciduliprofundum sp.]